MMNLKYSLSLGRFAGIRVFVHWTFLILIGWIVFINLKQGLGPVDIFWSVLFVLSIFACVTAHELGHALAARRYNIKTHNITLLPIGGVAQLESIPEKPKEELVVALAGPLVNIIIAGALYPFVKLTAPEVEQLNITHLNHFNFLPSLMAVNIWLALFNLIPAFPMDGGRVLRALLSLQMERARATRIAASVGQLLALGFIFFGFFFNPFLIFIGLFIYLGAQGEASVATAQSLLSGYVVADALLREIPVLEAGDTIEHASDRLLATQNRNFLVMKNGEPAGTLSRDEIIRALREGKGSAPVEEAMDAQFIRLDLNEPLEQAWLKLHRAQKSVAPVFQQGRLVGLLDTENISEFLMIRDV
ncbi:MAG: site-2 protease family protein, partial [Cyclobacteriaceae bacterium]|nr:site-2 protease family protein [Cyclobacteriaceae bacterium]MCX7636422.1 site-2 protease family protein [Cyclobacteriaceae bacterium]MDW8330865.1 site-2 protease family protein [Cyclobacteriaceae bacterium]